MAIATDIKKLGEDIIASHDLRVKAIGHLVRDTHKMLKGFHSDHREMGGKLRADLAKGEKGRLNDFEAMMGDIEKFVGTAFKDTQQMVKRFQSEHKEMGKKLGADLAKGEKGRLKDFEAMMSDIQEFVGTAVKDTQQMLKRFQGEHRAMADELSEDLGKGEADRLKAYKNMMGDIQKGIKGIETHVANKLKEFSEAHADMSEALKKDLAKYVAGIVTETKKLLKGYAGEREEMAANWESLAATMAKRRAGEPVKVEAASNVKTVNEAIQKPKAKKKAGKKKSGKE